MIRRAARLGKSWVPAALAGPAAEPGRLGARRGCPGPQQNPGGARDPCRASPAARIAEDCPSRSGKRRCPVPLSAASPSGELGRAACPVQRLPSYRGPPRTERALARYTRRAGASGPISRPPCRICKPGRKAASPRSLPRKGGTRSGYGESSPGGVLPGAERRGGLGLRGKARVEPSWLAGEAVWDDGSAGRFSFWGLGGAVRGELIAGCSPPFRPGGEAFWAEGRPSQDFRQLDSFPPFISEGKERTPFLKICRPRWIRRPRKWQGCGRRREPENLALPLPPIKIRLWVAPSHVVRSPQIQN